MHPWFPLAALASLALSSPFAAPPAAPDQYRMELRLDPEAGTVEGGLRLAYLNDSGAALEEIRLRLDVNLYDAESMQIRTVKDSSGAALEWRYSPFTWGKLSSERAHAVVVLPQPLPPGETSMVYLEFCLTHPRAVNTEMVVLQDDPYPSLDAWYPKAMSFRHGAWSIDEDRPSSYEVTLDAPEGIPFATTGSILEEREGTAGRVIRKLRAEHVRGFTLYGRAQWTVHRRMAEGVELRCFVAGEHESWAPKLLDAMADAIDYYRDHIGDFPTQHLDLITIYAERGGGAFACCNVIGMFLGPGVEERYRWFIAHEVAHQYFGSLVNQSRRELYWTLIGLGMVVDRNYLVDRGLEDAMHRRMIGMYRMAKKQGRDTTLSQDIAKLQAAEPPWSHQWNLVLGHAKAYSVCSMLEDLVGRERFRGVIRELLQSKAGQMITAADLVHRCEQASGEEFDWFVADWIDGDVTLDYAVGRVERRGGVWQVEVKRLGDAAYPVAVEAETESGKKLRSRVTREQQVQILKFETDEALLRVTIDPSRIYPDMDPDNDRWTG